MSFFSSKNKPSLSFIFDIRDSSISVVAARFFTNKKPEIILCKNFEFTVAGLFNHNEHLLSMFSALDSAVVYAKQNLEKIEGEIIRPYYFFLGSPWSVSQAKTIKIIKDKIFEIDNDVLKKIIFTEEVPIQKKIEDETSIPSWKTFEEKIIQAKINGYKIDNFFGKRTSNFAVELLVSFVPYEIKDKLSNYLNKKHRKDFEKQNHSFIMSSYSFLRDLYVDKNDFIYVNLGKLITDVYVVRDDVIFGIASFPFGEENIIETSLSKTNLSREVFLSHINIGQDQKFDMQSHNNTIDLLKSGFELWEEKLKESLSKICTEINIPDNLFIFTNSLISSILTREFWNKNRKKLQILGSKIDISEIKEDVFTDFILNSQSFLKEPYIKMDLVFVDKIFKK